MDQGFFQVSSFQPTRKSPRHMLPKRGPCLARHTSTSAGGSPAADSPPTRRRPAPASGPEAMPPRRSPRLVEDLHCNRPASQGIQPQPSNAAEMEAPLWRVTSWRVDTSTCASTRSKTDPLCRKCTGPVWRRCANRTCGSLASPRLGNPGVVPPKNGGCEHAHRLKTV